MFSKLFFREAEPSLAASTLPATMPAPLPSSFVAEQPATQMQQLLIQALHDVGVDTRNLPPNWRQLVTSELLMQMRGPNRSFQIDPVALKTLLVQLSTQPPKALAPAPIPTAPRIATPTVGAAAQQPAHHARRSHVDILQF
jgi:hypothetical protein